MTPRERAGLFIDQHCATMDYDRREKAFYAVWNLLEEVTKAAIEEDRKSRECCKQEREACAMIAHEELDIERDFAESRSGEDVAEYIEARIRARSEGE
jgi:hypothetical protein